ncbi:MAG: hypothetical protein E7523_08400 [Ruminococcaceae bacterium]|nr:hypothetical protein [Oscillospiraceae bacterium]
MTLFEHLQTCSIFEMADFIDEMLAEKEKCFEQKLQEAGINFTTISLEPSIRQKKLVDELMKEVGDGR